MREHSAGTHGLFRKIRLLGAYAAAFSTLLFSVPAFAADSGDSPSRSDKEWETLRDNTLEYSEIADLVHEYNATVQKSRIEYIQFRKDYGDTNREVSDAYQDAANDLWNSLEYPDSDDSSYASGMIAAANTEAAAKQMEQQALNTLEDSRIEYLEMRQEEDQIVSEAQQTMISCFSQELTVENAENDLKKAESDVTQKEAEIAAGTATTAELLSARASAKDAENTVESERSSLREKKQSLNVLCGWKAEDTPELGEIPEPDFDAVNSMDPSADLETAYQNNYTVRINQQKLANATAQDDIDTLTVTLSDNREKIASSLAADYQTVRTALDSMNLARANAELAESSLTQMQAKVRAGMATQASLSSQEYETKKAQNTCQSAAWALCDAIRAYQWDVNGLASAS